VISAGHIMEAVSDLENTIKGASRSKSGAD